MSGTVESIHLLHVDDEPGFADVVAGFLESEDDQFDVEPTTSASDGLELLAADEFDCVVSDYEMPGTNGIEFLETVREDDPDLPFILFTGKGSEEIASDAISAGVTDYLQKETGTEQYQLLANRVDNAVSQYRAERELEQTQRRLTEVTDASADVLWMFSRDWGEVLYINPVIEDRVYEEIYGRPVDELRTNSLAFLEAVHPEDRELVEKSMQRLSAGSSIDIEYRANEAEDYGRWVWVQGEPIFDDEGNVVQVAGFARDITARKERELELQQFKEEYETVFDAVDDGLLLVGVERDAPDVQFELRQLNAAYEAVSGHTSTEVRGQSLRDALGEEPWEKIAQHYRRCVETNEPVAYETVLELPAGTVQWRAELVPVSTDGDVRYVVEVTRDITEEV